jgi:uncharacterized protein
MERKVNFRSDGYQIAGLMCEPDEATEAGRPAVVLCQGKLGNKEYFWFPRIARDLASLGYAALIWDYRGIGESEGERDRMYPLEHAEDVRSALTFVENQPGVDPRRLALLGYSYGGALVPYVAAIDRRVRCAVSVVGWGDGERLARSVRRHAEWLRVLERIAEDRQSRVFAGTPLATTPEDFPPPTPKANDARLVLKKVPYMADMRTSNYTLAALAKTIEFQPENMVGQIVGCPMFYVAAGKDTVTPTDQVIEMFRRTSEPKKLWVIPGIEHYNVYEEPYVGQILEATVAWFDQHLRNASGSER